MEVAVGDSRIHVVEHGSGTPVLVLHGSGVDHRETEACFDPALARAGVRRIHPDLPGMGRSTAGSVRSAEDVLAVLLGLIDALVGAEPFLLVGHSAGAYFAQAIATRRPERVRGLALVCPLLPETRDVPPHRPVVADPELGDEGFRDYFVIQTPAMLERYERFVAPALPLADAEALARIGERWELDTAGAFAGPALVVAGALDATVGSAASIDLLDRYPRATLAVLDRAGHALPHEQPAVLAALLDGWLSAAIGAAV